MREKDLTQFCQPIRFNSTEFSLDDFQNAFIAEADKIQLPYSIGKNTIDGGGLFNSYSLPCFIVYHPSHSGDYFNYAFAIRSDNNSTYMYIYICGKSAQMKKEDYLSNTRIFDGNATKGTALGILRGGSVGVGFAVGSAVGGIARGGVKAIGKGIAALTMDKEALEAEKHWYNNVNEVIGSAFL